jgi:hypothetical protein
MDGLESGRHATGHSVGFALIEDAYPLLGRRSGRSLHAASPKSPATGLSDRHRGHQFGELDKIEHPPEIIGQRRQTEFGANLLQTSQMDARPSRAGDRARQGASPGEPPSDPTPLRSRDERLCETSRPCTASGSSPAEQIDLAAEQHELAEDRAEGLVVGAAEIGDGLEVGLQVPQQPDDLDVAMGLGFQAPARPDAVEVPVDVELQQILGRIARTASRLWLNPDEPRSGKIQTVNEGVDEADRIFCVDILVQAFGQKECLGAIVAGDVRHTGF